MNIRWATVEDAETLAGILIASWRAAYTQIVPATVLDGMSIEKRTEQLRTAISDGTGETAVAEADGQILGFCTLGECRDENKPKASTGEVWGIYLAPPHWRKGIGSELLRWAEAQLLAREKTEIVLWVLQANMPSRRFYEARGYAEDGATKQITIGTALTAIRYVKRFPHM